MAGPPSLARKAVNNPMQSDPRFLAMQRRYCGPGTGLLIPSRYVVARYVAGVPRPNNAAERAVRKAVLWRRGCFGSQSKRGLRFAERMLTVVATKRKRGEDLIEYLAQVLRATISGADPPPLLPPPAAAPA